MVDASRRSVPVHPLAFMSETSKYRHLTTPYCKGNGIDIASGGDAVVPWAMSVELEEDEYNYYNSNHAPRGPLHYRANDAVWHLPFKDHTLSFVYCSHWLEDRPRSDWPILFKEWARVLKTGGYLIILVPEVERWNYAVRVLGQPCNCSHSAPEPSIGEVSRAMMMVGLDVVEEKLTDCFEHDYSILAVAKKK
jgi:predicted SAM-dependent methyltransferase